MKRVLSLVLVRCPDMSPQLVCTAEVRIHRSIWLGVQMKLVGVSHWTSLDVF